MSTETVPKIQNIAPEPNSISRNSIADSAGLARAKTSEPPMETPFGKTLASLILEGGHGLPRRRTGFMTSDLHFTITHRFWLPHTLCREGEEVLSVSIAFPLGSVTLPFSTQLRVLFDYLARHQHVALTAAQIAAGINSHPFFRRYGANARGNVFRRRTVSRAGAKQQIMRLRRILAEISQRTGIDSLPTLIVSEVSDSNETGYRLKAIVRWLHIEY